MSLVDLVGWSLVHSLWEGALIALLLFGFLRLVDPRRSAVRYLASAVALFLVVLLPPITASLAGEAGAQSTLLSSVRDREESLDHAYQEQVPSEKLGMPTAAEEAESRAETSESVLRSGQTDSRTHAGPLATVGPRLRALFPWLVTLWVLGVLVLSVRLIGAWLRARQLRIDGTSAVDPAFEKVLDRLVSKLGVLRPVRLLQSSILQVPAVIGWLRPVVLIPVSLTSGLTIVQLEAILAHELAHVRRHDYLVNLLQALVETLLFYHPAIWWISRQTRQEREHCCDDVAVRACGDRKLYAGALLTIEEHRAIALLPAATGGDLLARIRRIAAPSLSHAETAPRWVAGLIAVASVLSIGATAAAVTPGKGELAAQDSPSRAPQFSARNADVAPDTVIHHPNPSAPLAERWEWSRQIASGQRFPAFWVGYTIDPMPGIKGTIYIGRLERRGITGNGGLNLRGRITNFGDFSGFNVPGVMLSPLVGGGMPDDVALLIAYVLDDRGRPVLARVHVSSLALPVDLEDRPLLWLGDSGDDESIALVQSLFASAPEDLKPDVVAALGVHGSNGAVPHLARWLEESENSDVREEAAEWLGRHPDPAALALLTRSARNDRLSDVRREAAEAVAEMTLPAATDSLIVLARGLRDTDARREAVEGLAEKSEPRALAAAVEIARNDDNTDVRREAVETLGEFRNGAGVPHLIELARTDRSTDVRMEAVETLGEAGNPEDAVRVLRQIIEEDPNEDVAREAVETLGEIDDPGAIAILRSFARSHPRAEVRKEAIETLAELDSGPETVAILSKIAREDQNEDVQSEALESLSEMGDPKASTLVAEVARNHANADVRQRAVEMLVEGLEPAAALEQLKFIATNDPSEEVQVEATETIAELPPRLAVGALSDLASNHPSEAVRMEALESLGEVDSPEAIEIVVKVAESRASTEVRREAIETIGERVDHKAALTVLSRIVRANDDVEVQREAVETIGENLGGLGVDVLADIARTHPNSEVRMEALESLTEMGASEVLEILVSAATSDASSDVQEEAVEGLAELPDGAGVAALIRIARDHPNRDLRSKALEALGESDDPRARAAIDRMLQQ
jgi:HEAT repeat protein/beta-lactamase regulating signal transducer with metallopeptidase domain